MAPSKILIVEDETLIGLDIEDILQAAGFETVGPARTATEALALIEGGRIDAALIDIVLADGSSVAVANALKARRIPFAVVSGNLARSIPPELADAPFVAKPSRPQAIVDAVRGLLGDRPDPPET